MSARTHGPVFIAMMAAMLPSVVSAQEAAPQAEAEDEGEIVVTGQRERGSVAGEIEPELQLRPADIRALGVNNVTELLAELAPQLATGQGSGPPVVLLEGRRISGFREIATLPAEAIARVDILPPEVALRYGFAATQRVANIVLRQNFRAVNVELAARAATGGGAFNPEGEVDYLRIRRNGRFTLNAEYEDSARLLERDRGVNSATGEEAFRTLLPAQQQFQLNATLSRNLANDISATINGEYRHEATQALFGLPDVGTLPLERAGKTQTSYLASTLTGAVADWRWTFTGNFTHVDSETLIDRRDSAAVDRASSQSDLGVADLTVNGTPLKLPAGDVSTTIRIGAAFNRFESASLRAGLVQAGSVARDVANGQVSIDLPIASRRRAILPFLGDLSINANAAAQRLSDYGTLRTIGLGATWSPLRGVELIASFTDDDGAPSPQQLGNPVVATPEVSVFDFVQGTNALVTQVTGGNPALRASNLRSWKLGATIKPFSSTDITFTGEFVRTVTSDGIAALPPASLAAEQAFPDRFTRDAAGELVQVDTRTVNFARAERQQLRWGINFAKPLRTSQAQVDALRAAFRERGPLRSELGGQPLGAGPGAAQGGGAGAGPGQGGRGRGGGFGGFGGGQGGGRLTLAVYHTVRLADTVTLREGLPEIDLLNGGVIGGGGGSPRHQVELQTGYNRNGIGVRATADWRSATRVVGASRDDDLRFGDLVTVNLRVFANPTVIPALIRSAPWLRGTRLTLSVNNLFDGRQRVTDGAGRVPDAYQPGYLDPLGRTIRISFRKLLF